MSNYEIIFRMKSYLLSAMNDELFNSGEICPSYSNNPPGDKNLGFCSRQTHRIPIGRWPGVVAGANFCFNKSPLSAWQAQNMTLMSGVTTPTFITLVPTNHHRHHHLTQP